MATLTIRNLPDAVRDRLRVRAAENGRSMEAEARDVLTSAAEAPGAKTSSDLDERVREVQEAFAPFRLPNVSIVDELIADRRLEAWREAVEGFQRMNEQRKHRPPFTP